MKRNNIRFLLSAILFVIVAIFFESCVDAVTYDDGNNTSTISITYPVTGDTVFVGRNIIQATFSSTGTIDHIEVFINASSTGKIFLPDSTIYFDLTEGFAGTEISLYLLLYNTNGTYIKSEVQTDLYVSKYPTSPTELTLFSFDNNSVLLIWKDNSLNETNYELWRSVGNNTSYGSTPYRLLAENQTNFSDFGLNEVVTYYYKVRAINSFGNSNFSNEVNTNGPEGRDAPTNLRAEALGSTVIRLSWTDNSSRESGFIIERKNLSNGGDWQQIDIVAPNTTEYFDDNLESNTAYSYRVAAILPTSFAYSNETTATTASEDLPRPTNLVADFDMDARKVYLHWSDNSLLEYGSQIERKEAGSSANFVTIGETDHDVTTYWDSTYTAGKTYSYRVRYKTAEGTYSMYSDEDTAYVPILPPKEPSSLTITEIVAGTTYVLNWEDESWDEDGFEVWMRTTNSESSLYSTLSANTKTLTITGLSSVNIYYFKIRAFKGNLYSDFTDEVVTPLLAPSNVTGVADNTPRVILSWRDNSTNETYFEIQRTYAGGTSYSIAGYAAANEVQFVDNNVYRGTGYNYRIRSVNNYSASEWTDVITVVVPSKK